MPDLAGTERWELLATRIPQTLHRKLELHCIRSDESIRAFVVATLRERLDREEEQGRSSPRPLGIVWKVIKLGLFILALGVLLHV